MEREVKIRIGSPAAMRARLIELGWSEAAPRGLERNTVYDTAAGDLLRSGRLLRLRSVGGRQVLTVKGPVAAGEAHKLRDEFEIESPDSEALRGILTTLGYGPVWRYEKYRTGFRREGDDGEVLLDETPIGNFIELEGAADWIGRAAAGLGYTSGQYILKSYGALYREYAAAHPGAGPDMTFDSERRGNALGRPNTELSS